MRPLWGIALLLVLLAIFGPYERVERRTEFDVSLLSGGVNPYLAEQEARFPDIRAGQQKRVVWRGLEEVPTDLALVYVHGFSASSKEIRPVPDLLAQELGANLVYTRLRGHGRNGAAMAEARAGDWVTDVAEALAIARKVGKEVVLIGTSTGASVITVLAEDPALMMDVKGIIQVSPNYRLNTPSARLLSLPAARYWLPLVAGKERSFEPQNPEQALYWTTEYPSTALFPMAAVAREARRADHGAIMVPVLMYYADADMVVQAKATDRVAKNWGGPVTRARPYVGLGVDPNAHVIAGDVLSPSNTEAAVGVMLDWIKGLE